MFRLFGKKKKVITLYDFDGNALKEGDLVESLRYDMGECKLTFTEGVFEYEATKTGKKVNWLKMIDASTERQKVRIIEES